MSSFFKFLVKNNRILLKTPHVRTNSGSNCSTVAGTEDLPCTRTMREIKKSMMERLGLCNYYSIIPKDREYLNRYVPRKEELLPRSMKDSFTSAIISLSEDEELQNKYVNNTGNIRMGTLMEDIDLFAVWVCHQHVQIPERDPIVHLPYTFVTILVEKVDFDDYFPTFNEDIRLTGYVMWVGNSTMEVIVFVEQFSKGYYHKITEAVFLMAARNATNTKSAPVNHLVPLNKEETKILSEGMTRQNRRLHLNNKSLLNVTPNDFEQEIIHKLFKRTLTKNSLVLNGQKLPASLDVVDTRWMGDSLTTNVITSFPDYRNAHNIIFGGYLIRKALENSWICACLYCNNNPKLKHICDISFKKPIDVSSFIEMTSYVTFTKEQYLQIMVVAHIISPGRVDTMTSEIFHLTYENNENVPEIIPKSYHEALWYLEGRRKFYYARNMAENGKNAL